MPLTRFGIPGVTTRSPRSRARRPASAICPGVRHIGFGSFDAKSWAPETSWNSVLTGPGQTAVTVTPVPSVSACTASAKLSANAFAAAYVALPGSGWKAAVELVIRIAPRPRRTIPGQVAGRQVDDRLDRHPDHLELALAVGLHERLVGAEPGIVDEQLGLERERLDLCGELVPARRRTEVGSDDLGADPVLVMQPAGELPQPVLTPGDERDAVATGGERLRERRAYAR